MASTTPNPHLASALSLQRQNKFDDALGAYRAALALEPDNATAHIGLAIVLQQLGRITEAEQHLRFGTAHAADKTVPLGLLAANLIEQGRVEEACDAANEACTLSPSILHLHSNRLLYSAYDYRLTTDQRYAFHREWGQKFRAGRPLPAAPRLRPPRSRLRIGYVSADFRNHPVATFLEPILRHHDHSTFEIFCYSDVKTEDGITARLRLFADHWISLHGDGGGGEGEGSPMTDDALAARIVADDIDILVDLSGHTQDNRLGVFALSPAPVQVTHIGYPGTTGLPSIGHRFSDLRLDPPGPEDALYSEETVRLPAFWCYQPPEACPPVGKLPSRSGAAFVFGSFNNLAKINPRVVEAWSRILRAVPDSRLLLKYKAFHDAAIRGRVLAAFERHGVEPSRVDLLPGTSVKQYMEDFDRIDLGLDPFPFNGGTTTFNSFYMGVPIIALEGRGHAERMGSALLRHVGLDDLIAQTTDEYVQRAVELAADRSRLAAIRSSLRDRMAASPLMDGPAYTRAFEAALQGMYERPSAGGASPVLRAAAPASKPVVIERTAAPSSSGTTAFSIIMCGRDANKRTRAIEHLSQRFHAHGFELLYVADPPSLAAGYNAAVAQAMADAVVFMHDDVQILNDNAPERIIAHLATYDIVGVAGTTQLVDGTWSRAGQPHIFGQVVHPPPAPLREGYVLCAFGGLAPIVGNIQAVDGALIAARRSAVLQVGFDEQTFDGFHLYDIDFSFRAYLAGLRVAVANDIHIFHASVGNYDATWRHYRDLFMRKCGERLPPIPRTKIWYSQIYCRTIEEARAKMERNCSTARGFTY